LVLQGEMVLPQRLLHQLFGHRGTRAMGGAVVGQGQRLLELILAILGPVVAEDPEDGRDHAHQVGARHGVLEQQQRHRDHRDAFRHVGHGIRQRRHQLTNNKNYLLMHLIIKGLSREMAWAFYYFYRARFRPEQNMFKLKLISCITITVPLLICSLYFKILKSQKPYPKYVTPVQSM